MGFNSKKKKIKRDSNILSDGRDLCNSKVFSEELHKQLAKIGITLEGEDTAAKNTDPSRDTLTVIFPMNRKTATRRKNNIRSSTGKTGENPRGIRCGTSSVLRCAIQT